MVMLRQSVNLTALFLGRLRPPKRLTSTSCTYYRQLLMTAFLESAEGEMEVYGRISRHACLFESTGSYCCQLDVSLGVGVTVYNFTTKFFIF